MAQAVKQGFCLLAKASSYRIATSLIDSKLSSCDPDSLLSFSQCPELLPFGDSGPRESHSIKRTSFLLPPPTKAPIN